jgi:soluble lytic murein transglycosylase-like protein
MRRAAIAVALAAEALLVAAACALLQAMHAPPRAPLRSRDTVPMPRQPALVREPFSVVIPELHADVATGAKFRDVLDAAARRHFLSPSLVAAVTRVESDFNPREVSEKGALGRMQVMPETAARFGVERHELFDPERNAAAGTAYLAWLLQRYHGNLDLALAAYNAGEGAVDQYRGIPPYRETQQYVRRVRAALEQTEFSND